MNFKYLTLLLIPLFFVACDKEEETIADKNAPSAIEQKIINFKAELTSNSREEITYTLEEAEWNLEALLNYEEANNEHNCNSLQFEMDVYQVPVTNGSISNSDLLDAYNHFLKIIETTTQDETIFSDLVDLSIVKPDSKDGEANIEMNYSFGIAVPLDYTLFQSGEDWKIGREWGSCGNNSSTENSDAEKQLEYRFNHPISSGAAGYFTDVNVIDPPAIGAHFDEDQNNPGYPYRKYPICDNCSSDDCIMYDELNYYLSKFDYIVEERNPGAKTYHSVDIQTDLITGDGKPGNWMHLYYIYYGDFHLNGGGVQ